MADDLQQPLDPAADDDAYRARWASAVRRERWRWAKGEPCSECGEWIGHWGGATQEGAYRPACSCIPLNVPLEEVRPNCFMVRCGWIGDAIRAATDRRDLAKSRD